MGGFSGGGSIQKMKLGIEQPGLLTGGQRSLLDQLTGLLSGQVGQGVSAYPGQITPGPSGLQGQAFGQISDILGTGGQFGGLAQAGAGTLQDLLKPFDPTLSMQAWEKGVKEPAMRTWKEEMMPGIMEKYAGANALESSGMRKELVGGGEKLGADISGQLAQILLQQQGQTQQTQLGAAGLGQQYAQMPLQQAMQGLQAGGTERDILSQQMQEPYQKWLTEQAYQNPWLQYLQQALGTQAFENIAYPKETKGFQAGASGGGSNCCFIVIQGEGKLTDDVRYVRDLIIERLKNVTIPKGYKKLAFVLVPLMKKSKFIHTFVRLIMTKPISIFSNWFIERRRSKVLFIPIGIFWLSVFNTLGGGKILNIPKTVKIMMGD